MFLRSLKILQWVENRGMGSRAKCCERDNPFVSNIFFHPLERSGIVGPSFVDPRSLHPAWPALSWLSGAGWTAPLSARRPARQRHPRLCVCRNTPPLRISRFWSFSQKSTHFSEHSCGPIIWTPHTPRHLFVHVSNQIPAGGMSLWPLPPAFSFLPSDLGFHFPPLVPLRCSLSRHPLVLSAVVDLRPAVFPDSRDPVVCAFVQLPLLPSERVFRRTSSPQPVRLPPDDWISHQS